MVLADFTRWARRDLDASPRWLVSRVTELIASLEENAVPRGEWDVKAISGMGRVYRIRIGDYRGVYDVDDTLKVVTVLRLTSRGDAYVD